MKRLVTALGLIFILSFLLYSWSERLLDRTINFVQLSEQNKILQNTNLQIQRTFGNAALALALNEAVFLNQANEILAAAQSSLDAHQQRELLKSLNFLQSDLDKMKEKQSSGQPVTKEDLLEFNAKVEAIGDSIHEQTRQIWQENILGYDELIYHYEIINLVGKTFQFFSLLLFAFLLYSIYRRELVEHSIKKQEKLHSLLFSSLSEAVFLCDTSAKIKACNFSCSTLTGVESGMLVGHSLLEYFPKTEFPNKSVTNMQNYRNLYDLIESGSTVNNLVMSSKEGHELRWYSINTQVIVHSQPNEPQSMIVSFSDITDRVNAQLRVQTQQEQLIESSKLRSIGEMASGIAHEINNPLAIIASATEMLSIKADNKEMLEADVVKKTTGKVLGTVERMSKIIKSLLSLSRGDNEEYETIDIRTIVDMAREFYATQLSHQEIDLMIVGMSQPITVECHPVQISQVILNLLKNSADAIKDHKQRWIKIEAIEKDQRLRLEISDSGSGIPKSKQEKILMPFYTTKPVGSGSGLGLSISRSIMQAHAGELGIDVTKSNTCFYIEFPKKQTPYNKDDIKVAA